MPATAIAFHRVRERIHDLSGVRTGSIRDQLLRATVLTECLVEQQQVGPGGLPLLVLGAGPAGMQAAFTAAAHGVDVTVVERTDHLFGSLYGALFRHVHPNEYDWPHPHFSLPTYPGHPVCGLHYRGQSIASLVVAWQAAWLDWKQYHDGRHGNGFITLVPQCDAGAWLQDVLARQDLGPTPAAPLTAAFPPGSPMREYGAAIVCFGLGEERTGPPPATAKSWSGYRGPRFWRDPDGIPAAQSGCEPEDLDEGLRHVIVSGAGDGALQDWQRLLTGRYGADLLAEVETRYRQVTGTALEPDWRRLMAAEDGCRRAHAWQHGRGIAVTLARWQAAYADDVQRVLQGVSNAHCQQIVGPMLRPMIRQGKTFVRWVMRDAVPTYCYGLNRYLCLMLEELMSRGYWLGHGRPGGLRNVLIHRHREIEAISPAPPSPQQPHRWDVQLSDRQVASANPLIVAADLILVRHGIEPVSATGAVPVPEQMLPYDLPA